MSAKIATTTTQKLMDVYLIRHTSIDVKPGVCYGQSDIDVSASFPEDSTDVRSKLPASAVDAVFFSSPLKRCRKLASELTSKEVHLDDRLQELDFGKWEGQKWDDIESDRLKEWMDDFVNVACPGGESYREMNERVIEWWDELIEKDFETVIVVTHAGVIRSLLSHVLGISYSNGFRLVLDWGHISAISVDDQEYSVKFVNR
jgi:alpha-ribazole phosphatase